MASNSNSSLALPPWPHGDRKPKTLGEFISRVNTTPGGFRKLTEEALREDVAAQSNGVVETSDHESAADSDSDSDTDQVKIENYHTAINDVRSNAELAHQNAMMALDFVSLLLTKEIPTQANETLSATLRDLVGIGTLGVDKLASSAVNEAQIQENKMVATGWKFLDIKNSADTLLSSASRLRKEISLETKYWAEVLGVSDNGWSVTRMPNERHTFGVRYGFSEAAQDFRSSSLARLKRKADGSVDLDCGSLAGEPKRLLVTIEKDGQVIGRSSLPRAPSADAALEDRVLEARNTIFAQELWHEINREARSLLSYGVQLEDEALSCNLGRKERLIFTLQSLEEVDDRDFSESRPGDARAESVNTALHLLLAYAHRQNNHRRSQANAAGRNQSTSTPTYWLIRPVLAHTIHHAELKKTTKFVSDLTTILQSAGVTTAMFKLTEASMLPNPASNSTTARGSPSEAFIHSLISPLEFHVEFIISPKARLLLHGKTILHPLVMTTYHIYSLPSSPSGDQSPDPLQELYPPAVAREGYPDLQEVKCYIREAVARLLTDRAMELAAAASSQMPNLPNIPPLNRGVSGKTLWGRTAEQVPGEIQFEVAAQPDDAGTPGADAQNGVLDPDDRPPELRVTFRFLAPKVHSKMWTWTMEDAVKGAKGETIDYVVRLAVVAMARLGNPQAGQTTGQQTSS